MGRAAGSPSVLPVLPGDVKGQGLTEATVSPGAGFRGSVVRLQSNHKVIEYQIISFLSFPPWFLHDSSALFCSIPIGCLNFCSIYLLILKVFIYFKCRGGIRTKKMNGGLRSVLGFYFTPLCLFYSHHPQSNPCHPLAQNIPGGIFWNIYDLFDASFGLL